MTAETLLEIKSQRASGEITVFLTLLLWVLFSLFGVMFQTVQYRVLTAYGTENLQAAVGAVGTKYAAPLWEDYHLMMIEGRQNLEGWLEQDTKKYIGERSGRLYHIDAFSANIDKLVEFTANQGKYFLYEMGEYMKYHGADRFFDEGENKKVLEASEATMEVLDQQQRTEQSVGEIDALTLELMERIEGVKIQGGRIKKQKHFVKMLCPQKPTQAAAAVHNEEVWKVLKGSYLTPEMMTPGKARKICKDIEEAEKLLDRLETKQRTVQKEVDNFVSVYQSASDRVLEESKRGIEEGIEKMQRYTGNMKSESIYDVDRMRRILNRNHQILLDYLENPEENCSQLENYEIQGLVFSYQGLTLKKQENPCSALEKAVDQHLLNLLVKEPNQLSNGGFGTETAYFDGEPEYGGLWGKAKMLSMEMLYLTDHLVHYQGEGASSGIDGKQRAGDYELEYLITGKNNDRDALMGVASRIAAARTAVNFVSILADSAKCSQAYEAAVASVGFTGMAALIEATKMAILLGWAHSEAMVDTALLLEGKTISLIKSGSSFLVSFTDLFHFGREVIRQKCAAYGNKTAAGGTKYKDYLLTFLAAENSVQRRNRSLNVIEQNMKLRYRNEFTFQGGIYGFTIKGLFSFANGREVEAVRSYAY